MTGRLRCVAIAIVVTVTSGCIGAIDRADFNDEVRRRGGGISSDWIDESIRMAAARLEVATPEDIELLTLTIDGTNRVLTVTARRGDRPEFVDSVVVRDGDVVSVSAVQDADQLPLDDLTMSLADLPLDRLETLADEAINEFDAADGSVSGIVVALADGAHTITFTLESSRRTGTAVFDVDGILIETTP